MAEVPVPSTTTTRNAARTRMSAAELRRQLADVIHVSGPMHFDRCSTHCSGPTRMEQDQASRVERFLRSLDVPDPYAAAGI